MCTSYSRAKQCASRLRELSIKGDFYRYVLNTIPIPFRYFAIRGKPGQSAPGEKNIIISGADLFTSRGTNYWLTARFELRVYIYKYEGGWVDESNSYDLQHISRIVSRATEFTPFMTTTTPKGPLARHNIILLFIFADIHCTYTARVFYINYYCYHYVGGELRRSSDRSG